MRVRRCLIWLSVLVVWMVAFVTESYSAAQEPAVTRWMDPLGMPKKPHSSVKITAPLIIYEEPKPPSKEPLQPFFQDSGRVCIVIHSELIAAVADSVSRYESDLVMSGYTVTTHIYSNGSAEDLRAYLAVLYAEPASLVGVVMVGDIPYVLAELNQDWGSGSEYEDFPCDLFYMDMDGIWSDIESDGNVQPGNGKYDTWEGNKTLEVWVSRIKADNLFSLGSESAVVNAYFSKNHRYRTGNLMPASTALIYNDDDWENMIAGDLAAVQNIYPSTRITAISDPDATTADDYKSNHMDPFMATYEMMNIRSHGYPQGHKFYHNSGSSSGYVYNLDYRSIDPTALFYSFFVCSGADFSAEEYLAGTVVFNTDDSGLLAWGSTKTGGMWKDEAFYSALGGEETFGSAFVSWFNTMQTSYSSYAPRWWYGMVLIGDAALRPGIFQHRLFAATIDEPSANLSVERGSSIPFEASVIGGIHPLSYHWDFDGASEPVTVEDPGSVVFNNSGVYSVVLSVTDDEGSVAEDSVTVRVNAPTILPGVYLLLGEE